MEEEEEEEEDVEYIYALLSTMSFRNSSLGCLAGRWNNMASIVPMEMEKIKQSQADDIDRAYGALVVLR